MLKFPFKVYAIKHNRTQKVYVGRSNNVARRFLQHLKHLKCGDHPVEDMQADFDKYGGDYSLFILDDITEHSELRKEYEWMAVFGSHIRGKGYNYKDQETEVLIKSMIGSVQDVRLCGPTQAPLKANRLTLILELLKRCEDIERMDLIIYLLEKAEKERTQQ